MESIYRTVKERAYEAACSEGFEEATKKGLTGAERIRFQSVYIAKAQKDMQEEIEKSDWESECLSRLDKETLLCNQRAVSFAG